MQGNEAERNVTILALSQYPAFRDEALTLLLRALKDPDPEIRWYAAGELKRFADMAERIRPYLPRMLQDENSRVREEASELRAFFEADSLRPR